MTSTERARAKGVAAVVFDLDGTLVDSRPDLTTAINALRRELGLAAVSMATVGEWIGEGARRLVERALGDLEKPAPADSLNRFLERYAAVATRETAPYPGIPALLAELRSTIPLALLTNKPERMTRAIVESAGWSDYFRIVVAGDSLPYRKPDPRTLVAIADGLELAVERLLLVGDSRIDAATASAVGASFVWVGWGYASHADREALANGPHATTARELAAIVATKLAD